MAVDNTPSVTLVPAAMHRLVARLAVIVAAILAIPAAHAQQPRILVFSKTAGFRHSSIPNGKAAIIRLGQQNGFTVDTTENAAAFTQKNLARYAAVVFLSTTGDVLDAAQQDDFERYIQAGGGYVGIHSATDTEYDWPWYGRLAGAYFNGHPNNPNVKKGTYHTIDSTHISTKGFPATFDRTDEFYNFKSIDPTIHTLVEIDESSYTGGTNGAHHPMSWYHDFDGGRAWYTNMGHTEESYTEPLFLNHILGGIKYAIGNGKIDFSRARPEENRFTRVVLAEKLVEPVELSVLPGEKVLFVERRGAVKLYTPSDGKTRTIATIPVSNKYADSSQAEDGLLGMNIDPNFASNHWVYMYYSPAGPEAKNQLARFTMVGDSLDLSSRKVLLEIPTQRLKCCHTGGSIAFDAKGNLYLSTGDNSNPFATGYAPIDERPGRMPWDAQKSSGNTNDLRGKIIRIHPEPDGTYTVPAGNLFAPGTPKTRPEIYTMGHRNPYRISVDKHTGYVYWGEVGPDANVDSAGRGPRGYDEINQARSPGNYGWPYFVGNNQAYYHFAFIDSANIQTGPQFDPEHPVNNSPNNTGLNELPPARGAYIWYPYAASPEFPIVGSGGRAAEAGPVFYRDDFRGAPRAFPQYYDGKLFIYEFMRHWIMAVTMDKNGDFVSMERFMPNSQFAAPIEMEFAPSGDMYILEYGTRWFQGNDDARLVRVEYNGGNRKPIVAASVDKPSGALPMRVKLSSAGTVDLDEDSLSYVWTISRKGGAQVARLRSANPTYTFTKPGTYTASLTTTDTHGASATTNVEIVAGNEPPNVNVALVNSNKTFFFPGVPVRYSTSVTDREDGSLRSGSIAANRVHVSAQYLKSGLATGNMSGSENPLTVGRRLIEGNDCLSCHQFTTRNIGPAYTDVAKKYHGDNTAVAHLVKKIREGGSGVWGSATMPAHPSLSETQTHAIVAYILSLAERGNAAPQPVRGSYMPPAGSEASPQGVVELHAEYTDRGGNGMPAITGEKSVMLRSPTMVVADADLSEGASKQGVEGIPVTITVVNKSGASVAVKQIDLTGIGAVTFMALAPSQYQARGGKIEVHLDSPTGALLGESQPISPTSDQAPLRLRTTLRPTSGMHDLYFVFTNPAVKDGFLFALTTATFEPAGQTAAR